MTQRYDAVIVQHSKHAWTVADGGVGLPRGRGADGRDAGVARQDRLAEAGGGCVSDETTMAETRSADDGWTSAETVTALARQQETDALSGAFVCDAPGCGMRFDSARRLGLHRWHAHAIRGASAERVEAEAEPARKGRFIGPRPEPAPGLQPNFVTFQERLTRQSLEPTVALYAGTHVLAINRAAWEKLGKPEFVEILFDRGAWLVGLRKVEEKANFAYKVQAQKTTWLIHGKAFVKWAGIAEPQYAGRYPAKMFDDVLAFQISEEDEA